MSTDWFRAWGELWCPEERFIWTATLYLIRHEFWVCVCECVCVGADGRSAPIGSLPCWWNIRIWYHKDWIPHTIHHKRPCSLLSDSRSDSCVLRSLFSPQDVCKFHHVSIQNVLTARWNEDGLVLLLFSVSQRSNPRPAVDVVSLITAGWPSCLNQVGDDTQRFQSEEFDIWC